MSTEGTVGVHLKKIRNHCYHKDKEFAPAKLRLLLIFFFGLHPDGRLSQEEDQESAREI